MKLRVVTKTKSETYETEGMLLSVINGVACVGKYAAAQTGRECSLCYPFIVMEFLVHEVH